MNGELVHGRIAVTLCKDEIMHSIDLDPDEVQTKYDCVGKEMHGDINIDTPFVFIVVAKIPNQGFFPLTMGRFTNTNEARVVNNEGYLTCLQNRIMQWISSNSVFT
ncbi:hypothetical protein AB6A40_007441 [Gnathostoma spinigerum]|uniref:Uncharacterized protein n=1 Tax=Gnathostoma spinigerum TaxID=75299 RepID=A0ABD6EVM3_9BILA